MPRENLLWEETWRSQNKTPIEHRREIQLASAPNYRLTPHRHRNCLLRLRLHYPENFHFARIFLCLVLLNQSFFLSGPWIMHHQEIAKQIKSMGYEIGSHGYMHKDFSEQTER